MVQKKHVLVQGINYAPEQTGMGKYTASMVDYMVQQGIICTVVTSYPFHPEWKVQSPYKNSSYIKEVFNDGLLTVYRCPMYVPANPTGLTRILQETSFIITSSLILLKLLYKRRFDAFITVSPPFHLGLAAILFKAVSQTKVVYHIQDLQVDLAKELSLIKSRHLLNLLFKLEKYILSKVDYVSTISEGMIKKIKMKAEVEVVLFPNWVNMQQFYPIENKGLLKAKWNFSNQDYVVLYSGNLGEKQGLEIILDVAKKCRDLENIKFIICGNGAYKLRLIAYARKNLVDNIFFIPMQPEKTFNEFLNIADLHLILQKGNAADLVMPSKLTTILAVGGQLIATANPNTSLYDVVINHNLGIVTEPDNIEELYQAILAFSQKPKATSINAREFAREHLSSNKIISEFLENIDL